jgi:hypothetical protein
MKMKRRKLQNNINDFYLSIAGSKLYVDIESLMGEVIISNSDEGMHINAPKYETLRLMLDVLMSENEIVDDLLGVKSLNKATIPFKISLNTLINYNIIKEIKN